MNEITANTRLLLILSQLAGVGPATLKKVINIPNFLQLSTDQLASKIPAIERALNESSAWDIAQEAADNQIKESRRFDARIISALDDDYPKLLSYTKDDPLILFVKGCLAPNPDNSVAIIGTRQPTMHGELIAKRVTQYFAEDQWSVVSGLAIGCDSIAHTAALDAGGHTVAVLAHGLQMIAPSQNKKLADRILNSGGALVSEYPFGRAVQRQQYVKRDRTQAGLAQGVIMIQSDIVGGSLHASRAALDYHRWLAVPFPTEKDRNSMEPKIQANMLIALGSNSEKANLLKCSDGGIKSILILKSKEDYSLMKVGVPGITAYNSQVDSLANSTSSLELSEKNDQFNGYSKLGNGNENEAIFSGIVPTENIFLSSHYTALSSKSILQPVANNYPIGSWSELLTNNSGLTNAVTARLNYLRVCLERVQENFKNFCDSPTQSQQHNLCFSIDDFICQMTHATELLVAVHFILAEPSKYHSLRVIEKLKAKRFSDSTTFEKQRHDTVLSLNCEISIGLKNFVDSSAERLITTSENMAARYAEFGQSLGEKKSSGWIEEVLPRLEGLCDGFNHLVRLVLFDQNDSDRYVAQHGNPAQH